MWLDMIKQYPIMIRHQKRNFKVRDDFNFFEYFDYNKID